MTRSHLTMISIAAIGLMIVAAIVTLVAGPPHDLLPVHWAVSGEADGYARPWLALLSMPLAAAGTSLLFALLPRIEPLGDGLARSSGLVHAVWLGVLGVLAVADAMVLGAAWGWRLAGARLIVAAVGLLFVLLGNQLGKSRRMYLVGIRTPWTLADENVWIATHRLGGKLMVAAGLLWVVVALVTRPGATVVALLIAALLVGAIVPVVYSYLLWRKLAPMR